MKIAVMLFATLSCIQLSRSEITLILKNAGGVPIQGVSCTQAGGSTSISDQTGRLILTSVSSGLQPERAKAGRLPLSLIPLASGEKAALTVTDISGRIVMQREVSLGDRIDFSREHQGVYFANIASRNFSVRGRFTNLGQGMVFEGISPLGNAAPALAKTAEAAAGDLSVTCSKGGYPTQVYRVADGTTLTIDFSKVVLVPLHDQNTKLEPDNIFETPTALVTRFSDRGRDRHAREDQYKAYDHYLTLYWQFRTATIQITDEVAKGGKKIRIDQWTLWPLDPKAREFRAFYRGIGTVAEYHLNVSMDVDPADPLHYFTEFTYNGQEKREIRIGDKMEIEVSQFLAKEGLEGRDNYYGTTYLYMVGGGGMVPWDTRGVFGDAATERENSYPLPEESWLGGRTTIHQQMTDEPADVFMQMATNLAPQNGQPFVLGRRVLHTNFLTGEHDEPGNPVWDAHVGKSGPNYVNTSCSACHHKNGRALPPAVGAPMFQYVIKVGDAEGKPHPQLGGVLQPQKTGGSGEGSVALGPWTESGGLRKPTYAFSGGPTPTNYSARVSPQLVGMGLLEAIPETAILALEDADDANKDGISGKVHVVTDYVTGSPRVGRFGWKAGKPEVAHQVAGALNSDMGVMTAIYPAPDCGSAQGDCGKTGAELDPVNFQNLVDYISLLGVRARRDAKDPTVMQGEALFKSAGCVSCHVPTLTTGKYHPKAELRNQTIHPFTDLLLHDMGPGLADNLPEGQASGAEWRTAPLWNIGMTAGVSGGEAYLHDGRARTLNEAILWHGGEAEKAAARFKEMSSTDSDALIKFLKSL